MVFCPKVTAKLLVLRVTINFCKSSCIHSAYSHLLMKYYNTIPEDLREYKESTRIWWFDMSIYERFICFMHSEAEYKDTFEVVELPRFLTRGIANYVEKINNYRMKSAAERTENVNNFDDTYKLQYIVDETNYDMILNRLDEKLQTKLLPFQLKGISFIINRAGRGLIGDEMGCGKTLQAIGCMQYYRNHWPVLILLPPTLINQWKHELLLNCSRSLLSDKDISVVKKASDVVCGKVTLISYFLLDKLTASKTLSPDRFGVVIADESQNLKNKDAKRTYNALPFLKQAKVAICLSGTPALNRPVELYTQLHAVVPYVFNDYDAFVRRYCDAKPSVFLPNVMDVRGSSNEIELRLLLESMVMIRRLKDEVISDEVLGSKLREVRYVHPNQGLMKQFDKLKKQEKDIERKLHDPSIDVSTKSKYHNEQRILTNFRYQLTGKVKVHKVLEELRLLLQEAKKDKAVEMADKKESEMVASVTECIDVSDDEICRVGGKSGVPDDFMCGGDGEGSIESRDSIAEVAPIPINVVHYHPFVDDVLSEASSVGSADEDSYPVSFEDTTTRAELVGPEISVPSDDTATSYCSFDAASLLSPQPELLKKSMLASRAAPVIMKLEADGIGNGNKVDVASERGWSQSNPGLGELDLDEGLLNTQESVKVPYVRGLKRLRKTAHTSSSLKSRITPTLRCGGYKKAKMLCGASTCTSDEGSDSDDIEWTDAGENEICICKPNGRSEMLKKCTSAPSSNRGKGPDAVSEWDSDDDLLFFDCAFNEAPKNDDAIADKITMESIHCAEGPHGSVGMQHSSDAIRPRNSTTKLKMGTNQKLENQSLNKSSANGDKSDPETKIAKKASHKILVFGHHKDVMDELEEGIREMDVDYIRIDGQTSLAQRNACVLRFQGDDVVSIACRSGICINSFTVFKKQNVDECGAVEHDCHRHWSQSDKSECCAFC